MNDRPTAVHLRVAPVAYRPPLVLILVRHALAVPRTAWDGDDRARPLKPRGERQAVALPALLSSAPIEVLVSSPTLRCKATLRPLARERGLKVKTSSSLREGRGAAALDLALDAVGDVLLCTHGDVLLDVLQGLRRLGWPIPARPGTAKGSVWLLARDECAYLPPQA